MGLKPTTFTPSADRVGVLNPARRQLLRRQPFRFSAVVGFQTAFLEAEMWLDLVTSKPACFADWAIESS